MTRTHTTHARTHILGTTAVDEGSAPRRGKVLLFWSIFNYCFNMQQDCNNGTQIESRGHPFSGCRAPLCTVTVKAKTKDAFL